jgi:hypothetical protein
MSYILNFERRSSYLYITVTGENSYDNVLQYLSEVRDLCEQYKCTDVLIVENLGGPSLDTFSIFDIISKVSEQTIRVVKNIAYVDINPAHNVDEMAFAENVAVNRGVNVQIFSDIYRAEQWLEKQGNPGDNQ